jgi:hypothetical protein
LPAIAAGFCGSREEVDELKSQRLDFEGLWLLDFVACREEGKIG